MVRGGDRLRYQIANMIGGFKLSDGDMLTAAQRPFRVASICAVPLFLMERGYDGETRGVRNYPGCRPVQDVLLLGICAVRWPRSVAGVRKVEG